VVVVRGVGVGVGVDADGTLVRLGERMGRSLVPELCIDGW